MPPSIPDINFTGFSINIWVTSAFVYQQLPGNPGKMFVAKAIVLLALIASCDSHGILCKPRARGTLNHGDYPIPDLHLEGVEKNGCAHCLNAGGPGAIKQAAKGKWRPYDPLSTTAQFPKGFGLCGDRIKDPVPRAHEKHGKYGPPPAMPYSAVYRSGQKVDFIADITTAHTGFFEFFICDVGKCGGDISEKCFKGGHCHRLLRAPSPECDKGNSWNCAPIDKNYPGRWYNPCRTKSRQQLLGGKFMRYYLPKNFECADCVIQWYWMAGQNCSPPGMIDFFKKHPMKKWARCKGDSGTEGGRNPNLPTCGSGDDGPVPEEFWNCADVRVMGDNVGPPKIMPPKEAMMTLPADALITLQDVLDPAPEPNHVEVDDDYASRNGEKAAAENNAPGPQASKMTPHPTNTPIPMSNDIGDDPSSPCIQTKKAVSSQSPEAHEHKRHSSSTATNMHADKKSGPTKESSDMGPVTIIVPMLDGGAGGSRDRSEKLRSKDVNSSISDANSAGCVAEWKQCGGKEYNGPADCCSKRFECVALNPYYAQCKAPERPRK